MLGFGSLLVVPLSIFVSSRLARKGPHYRSRATGWCPNSLQYHCDCEFKGAIHSTGKVVPKSPLVSRFSVVSGVEAFSWKVFCTQTSQTLSSTSLPAASSLHFGMKNTLPWFFKDDEQLNTKSDATAVRVCRMSYFCSALPWLQGVDVIWSGYTFVLGFLVVFRNNQVVTFCASSCVHDKCQCKAWRPIPASGREQH